MCACCHARSTVHDLHLLNPPDPASWRKGTLRALNAADADVEIELLRPLSWLESQGAAPGSVIHVEIAELNLDGDARVLSIEPCPPIEPGPGAVVTGRFSHISNDLVDVWVEGLEEPITGTSQHPFWSVTRQAWVAACELQTGEILEMKSRTAQVVSVGMRDDARRVYNLEIAQKHTYRISKVGVLVHNASEFSSEFRRMQRGSHVNPHKPTSHEVIEDAIEDAGLTFRGRQEATHYDGKLGKPSVRIQIAKIAAELRRRGWTITGGGQMAPEEFIPGPGGGRFASGSPDITAEKVIRGRLRTLRVNTMTMNNGVPIDGEISQALRIRTFGQIKDGLPNRSAHLLLIPKSG